MFYFKWAIYRTLHELSFNINFYETSLGNVIKRTIGEICNVSATIFIKVCIKRTMRVKSFYHMTDEGARAGPAPGHFSHGYSYIAS